MMKILVFAAAVSLLPVILGCSQQQQQHYGNFTKVDSQSLVNDAVAMMLATYPPAQTRLDMFHEPGDAWGDKLVRLLRTHGYAVSEYSEQPMEKDKYAESGKRFGFILDEYLPEKEFHLTLFIGDEVMSRSYAVRGSDDAKIFVGLGHWSRRR